MDYKKLYAQKQVAKERIIRVNPTIPDTSGIYIFHRVDENGFRHAYIGQAINLMERLVSHLMGYEQYIDLSIRKHGLFGARNEYGYKISYIECAKENLNEIERIYIKEYANNGYQLKNVTLGGQDEGKVNFNDNKPRKGYREGVEYGRKKEKEYVQNMFRKYLKVDIKRVNAISTRKYREFIEYLGEEGENDND